MKNPRLLSYNKFELRTDFFDLSSVSKYLFDVHYLLHDLSPEDRELDMKVLRDYHLRLLEDYVLIVRWGKPEFNYNYLTKKSDLKELFDVIKNNTDAFPFVPGGDKIVQMLPRVEKLQDYSTWKFSFADIIALKLTLTRTGWETTNW